MSIFRQIKTINWRSWVYPILVLALIGVGYGLAHLSQRVAAARVTPTATSSAAQPRKRIVIIVHGDKNSSFWPKVERGAIQAEQDYNLEVEFILLNKSGDYAEMSSRIEQAIATNPDGMAITVPDKQALEPAIYKIVQANIPFVVINAGQHNAKELGALTYIGQLDYVAGRQAGLRMAELGVRHAYCVSHDPTNVAIRDRCDGFIESMLLAGGQAEILVVDRKNLNGATTTRIKDLLTLYPETDGLLTTADMPFVLDAVQEMGLEGQIKLGGFDFTPKTLENITAGKMLFAIDQQPYLQGYLSVTFFNLFFSNDNLISQDEVATGPNFITSENAGRVKSLTAAGTR